jgi:cytochrome c oxidase assembly protein subunit 15
MTAVCVLLACQGVVGGVQYELGLPTEIVWVHIILATATWLSVLWSVAEAGRLEPRRAEVAEPESSERLRAPAGVSA